MKKIFGSIIFDIVDNIQYYYKNIKYFINDIFYGIKNIITYAPLIYRDRDWDFSYIDIMLRFKLKRMSELLRIKDRHTTTQQHVKQINFCIKLLDRLIADDYTHPEYLNHLDVIVTNGTFKSKRLYTDEQFKKWMEWENHWKSRDRRLLYKILDKHIEEWWD